MIPNNLNLVRSTEIVKQFHEIESDRAAAILAACYVDECLKDFIRLYMVEEPEIAADKLLNGNSVHSFYARIEFARACDWITEDIKKDLHTIRHIRNEFSHNPDQNDFSQIPDCKKFQDFSRTYDSDNLRPQYLFTVSMTVGDMWNIIRPILIKKQESQSK